MTYISTPANRASSNDSFGLAIVRNVGTAENPEYRNDFKVYRDQKGGLWVTGEFGAKYGIEFIVPRYGRYKAVASVDGRNIVTGNKSSGSANERSWVISYPSTPGANVIPGWKQDGNDKVADFVLTEPEYSYAVLTGSETSEVGVIAVRYYHELQEFRMTGAKGLESMGASRGGGATRGGATRSAGMGTGYGGDTKFKSSTTEFIVDPSVPPTTLIIRIAQENELVAAGCTLVYPTPAIPGSEADPFPLSNPGVTPPKGHNPYR